MQLPRACQSGRSGRHVGDSSKQSLSVERMSIFRLRGRYRLAAGVLMLVALLLPFGARTLLAQTPLCVHDGPYLTPPLPSDVPHRNGPGPCRPPVDVFATFQTSPMPTYPPALAKAKIEGSVALAFVVDANGKIDSMKMGVRYTDPLFAAAVRAVFSQWKVIPAQLHGQAVAQWNIIAVAFRLTCARHPVRLLRSGEVLNVCPSNTA